MTRAHEPRLTLPRTGEVDLWRLRLDAQAAAEASWRALLAADERQRADRFHFARDRVAFTATRGVLRALLGRYLDSGVEALSFRTNEFGKPLLAAPWDGVPLTFNVAHSGDYALLAFASGAPVGVDIERIRSDRDIDGLAATILSPAEYARFLESADRRTLFFRTWSCKEAVLKAVGCGLSIAPSSIEILFTPSGAALSPAASLGAAGSADWSIREPDLAPGYAAAIALPAPLARTNIRSVDRDTAADFIR